MLPLDSPRWSELTHAYGVASDIPALLRKLATAPPKKGVKDEPWFSLWSSLCHQNDVYTASYAALPHILTASANRPINQQTDSLLLASCIEAMRHAGRAPAIPGDLLDSYHQAVQVGIELAVRCLKENWNEVDTRVILGALAIFRGHYKLGMAILDLEETEDCPNCEKPFTTRGYDLF